jgi:hypothetical protein
MNHSSDAAVQQEVRKYSTPELTHTGLPAEVQKILGGVGLPKQIDFLFTAGELKPISLHEQGEGISIGSAWHEEYDMVVAVSTGMVYAVHRQEPEITFVNTTLQNFLEFLHACAKLLHMQQQDTATDPAAYSKSFHQAVEQLTQLDPAALTGDVWWSGALEDFSQV